MFVLETVPAGNGSFFFCGISGERSSSAILFRCLDSSRRLRKMTGIMASKPRKQPVMKKQSTIRTSGPRNSYPQKKYKAVSCVFFSASTKKNMKRANAIIRDSHFMIQSL